MWKNNPKLQHGHRTRSWSNIFSFLCSLNIFLRFILMLSYHLLLRVPIRCSPRCLPLKFMYSTCSPLSLQSHLFASFIHQWLYSPLLVPGHFSVSYLYTQSVGLPGRGISQSQSRCLHTEQHKYRIKAFMTRVGFEPTSPMLERAKRVHPSHLFAYWYEFSYSVAIHVYVTFLLPSSCIDSCLLNHHVNTTSAAIPRPIFIISPFRI
jgi:hypothetical protein